VQVGDNPFPFQNAVQEVDEEFFRHFPSENQLESKIGERIDSFLHIVFRYCLLFCFLQKYGLFSVCKIFFRIFFERRGKEIGIFVFCKESKEAPPVRPNRWQENHSDKNSAALLDFYKKCGTVLLP
jgi:hypothetical protein